jgi:hypothetical protein
MRTRLFTLLIGAAILVQGGCAAGFQAGGRDRSFSAGAAVGTPVAPLVIEESPSTPPPPLAR